MLSSNEANSIMVVDYPENIKMVKEYLDTMDVPPQQVLIESRVVEVRLKAEHAFGINWDAFNKNQQGFKLGEFVLGGANSTVSSKISQSIPFKPTYYPPAQTATGEETPFTFTIFTENLNAVLNMLANSLDMNILSAPRVTTVNNREAEIKVIQSLPWAEPQVTMSDQGLAVTWEVNFEEVGISLKATPTINEDGNIVLELNPEVSEKIDDYELEVIQGTTELPYTVPIIDTRSASTKVVVGNGQTIIIGGLIKDKITKGETKVPLFGDIPFLKHFFRSTNEIKEKTELLIFVSPTIITPKELLLMANDERYRIGKSYMEERERQQQMILSLEQQKQKDNRRASVDKNEGKQE